MGRDLSSLWYSLLLQRGSPLRLDPASVLYQVAQSLVQLSFEYLQGWRSHSLSGPVYSVDNRLHNVMLAHKERCPRSQEVPACTSAGLLLLQKPKPLDAGEVAREGAWLFRNPSLPAGEPSLLYMDFLEQGCAGLKEQGNAETGIFCWIFG